MVTFQESVAPVKRAVALDRLLLVMYGNEMLCLVALSKIFVALLCYSSTGYPPLKELFMAATSFAYVNLRYVRKTFDFI